MPPCAAPEWLRPGWTWLRIATSMPSALCLDGGAEPREPAADDDELMVRHDGPLN